MSLWGFVIKCQPIRSAKLIATYVYVKMIMTKIDALPFNEIEYKREKHKFFLLSIVKSLR